MEKMKFGADDVLFADLDRTLIKSDNLSSLVYGLLRGRFRDDKKRAEKIDRISQEELANKGNSYEYLRLLMEKADDSDVAIDIEPKKLAADLIAQHKDAEGFFGNVLCEGAVDLLKSVKETNARVVLMTAGDKTTQRFKVELVIAIMKQLEIHIDGWIITKEGQSSKAQVVDSLFGSVPSEPDRFVMSRLRLEAREEVIDCDVSQLEGESFDRATIIDDKQKHGELPPESRLGEVSIIDGFGVSANGKLRTVLMVANGVELDAEERLSLPDLRALIEQQY